MCQGRNKLGNEKQLSWASGNHSGDGNTFTHQEIEDYMVQWAECQDSALHSEPWTHSSHSSSILPILSSSLLLPASTDKRILLLAAKN